MGNTLALMMLAAWPVVAALLFSRLDQTRAVIWTMLAGYLLLPPAVVALNIPLLPQMNKYSITALAATVGALMLRQHSPLPWRRPEGWVMFLVGLTLLTPMFTVITNPEPLIEGVSYRPGLTVFDFINGTLGAVLDLLPFLLGYMILSSIAGIRAWMTALTLAVLAYSLPMLLEIRLSPQLNVWIYGFFAHDFSQSIRYGGYRPMVFLEHGLWVALFAVTGVLTAAVALRDAQGTSRTRHWAVLIYLLGVLFLCKSVASMLYALTMVPLLLFMPPMWHVRVAAALALAALMYPLLLWLGLFPITMFGETALALDAERGRSLIFRFNNEQVLLDRASLKPLAGWGGWGRNLEVDPNSGDFTSVSDGYWIVVMTMSGVMGYVGIFGLLCGSVVRIWMAARRDGIDRWTAGLALIMAANLVDLIPNATVTPLSWLSAGALAGLAARGATAPAAAKDTRLMPATTGQAPLRTILR